MEKNSTLVEKENLRQNFMTKKTESKSKPTQQKRKKRRYLTKNQNTKRRQDYMDNIQYVNGVRDKTGKKVMRDLNEEELDWLSQFNKEYYNASRKDAVFHTEDEDWVGEGGLYEANNARNRCLLNIGKATNTVDFITMGSYDQNTIKALEGHDLELLLAYNAGLVEDLNDDGEELSKSKKLKKSDKNTDTDGDDS